MKFQGKRNADESASTNTFVSLFARANFNIFFFLRLLRFSFALFLFITLRDIAGRHQHENAFTWHTIIEWKSNWMEENVRERKKETRNLKWFISEIGDGKVTHKWNDKRETEVEKVVW